MNQCLLINFPPVSGSSGAGVQEFKPGDRIAAASPHAGVASVGINLCAPIPDDVSFEQAAYTSIAPINLHLAHVSLGVRESARHRPWLSRAVYRHVQCDGVCRVYVKTSI